eukprot:CAMPEP_0197877546 /NCGR_PEP_ID=MMETSP1439-20131203/6201_1 /TAXON_ID=66791 /ORGANISM="Gonyaulax spinifera, Strain CCMP409" /LENGTH=664 /DNA_ID=CAMNT_0043496903 /DNA_START=340 /DNA_END=2334 /DNA_ORIENTATION=-
MVFPWKSILLVQIFSFNAKAARLVARVAEEVAKTADVEEGHDSSRRTVAAILSESGNLCGSRQIHSLLQVDETGMRSTQWEKLKEIANQHLKDQSGLIRGYTKDIAQLKAKLKDQKSQEKSQDMSVPDIQQLITRAVADKARFGDMASAVKAQCGYLKRSELRRLKLPVKLKAYRNSEAVFKELITERFAQGDVRTDSSAVLEVCRGLLPVEDSSASYCDDLCTSFAASAQKASDDAVGAKVGPGSEQVAKEVEMAISRLKMAVASKVTCEAAKDAIEGFQRSIEPLELNIRDARDRSEDARDALDQAEDTVTDLEQSLEEQESATARAQETAEAKSDEMKQAKQHLAEVNALKFIVKTRMKVMKKKMDKAKQSLTQFNEAEHVAQQLKLYVQKAMLSMDLYFEMAVREPLRKMKLVGKWEDAFEKTSTADAATVNLEESIKALDSYCRRTAKPAFDLVDKSVADLAPICEFGEVRPTVDNLYKVVDARKAEVMRQLTLATAWLDKFHGQPGMTQELADEYVNEGEPKGLREIIGSLSVEGYLYEWRADGPFLDFLKRLGGYIEEQAKASADLQESLMGLTSKLRETETQRAVARLALKVAINSDRVAHAEKEEAEELLASQTMETEEANNRLDELQSAADAAWKKFQQAKVSLIKAFKSSTTL